MSFSILRLFFFSSRRRHTRYIGDWSSDVCSSDLQRMSAIDNRLNEKVYTLSLLSIALVLWLIVRWDDQPAGEAHDHHLLMIVLLLALTSTYHMMGVLVGPAVAGLLFAPLKSERPTDEAGRHAEWSQWA